MNVRKIHELSKLFSVAATLNNLLDNMTVDQAAFVLRLSEGGEPTKQEVNRAYRRLVLQYHPDKPTGNDTKFKLLNKAKDVMLQSLEPNDEVVIEPVQKVEYGKLKLVKNPDVPEAVKPPWGDWVKKEWK